MTIEGPFESRDPKTDSAVYRKKIGNIPSPKEGEPFEIFESTIINADEILKFKPKNYKGTIGNWLLSVRLEGNVEHPLNHAFQDWMNEMMFEKKEIPVDSVRFGELDEEFEKQNGKWPKMTDEQFERWKNKKENEEDKKRGQENDKRFKVYTKFILDNISSKTIDQLGYLGIWAKETGLKELTDIIFLKKIVQEYLED